MTEAAPHNIHKPVRTVRADALFLWRCFREFAWLSGILTATIAANYILWPYGQVIFGRGFDAVIEGEGWPAVWHWLVILMVVTVVRCIALYASQVLRARLGMLTSNQLRRRLLHHIQGMDQAAQRRHGVGELVTRTTRDMQQVRLALTDLTFSFLETGVMVAASLVFLWISVSPLTGLGPTILVGIALIMLWRQAAVLVRLNRAEAGSYERVVQDLTEGVHGVRVVKAFSLQDARENRFVRHLKRFLNNYRQVFVYSAKAMPWPMAVVAIGHGWVLAIGAWEVSNGVVTTGELVAGLMMVTTVIFRMDEVGERMRQAAVARSSVSRIRELLEEPAELLSGSQRLPPGPLGLNLLL